MRPQISARIQVMTLQAPFQEIWQERKLLQNLALQVIHFTKILKIPHKKLQLLHTYFAIPLISQTFIL